MKKNININISVDGVDLDDLASIQEAIDELFQEYPDQRITMTLQDEPLVAFR